VEELPADLIATMGQWHFVVAGQLREVFSDQLGVCFDSVQNNTVRIFPHSRRLFRTGQRCGKSPNQQILR